MQQGLKRQPAEVWLYVFSGAAGLTGEDTDTTRKTTGIQSSYSGKPVSCPKNN